MFRIQPASETDIEEICSFDQIAQQSRSRVEFIRRTILAGSCYIAVDSLIKGYAVMDYSFFEEGFIPVLYVHPDWRRHGIGKALMIHFETLCKTGKIFTSTNLSNKNMQSLLSRLEYKLSGVIHDLDENDPELVYVKYLKQSHS